MKNYTLVVDEDPGLRILGLVHKDRVHRTVWQLNKKLTFQLRRVEDICLKFDGQDAFFPAFASTVAESETDYTLVRNRGTLGYLMQEYKQLDLLLIERNYDCAFNPDLIKNLGMAGIDHVMEINYSDLKPETRANLEI